jgi:hypothetical protein
MYSTNLVNETKKEYFIVADLLSPDKIGAILLRLETMGWDLRLHNIYIQHGTKLPWSAEIRHSTLMARAIS